MNCRDVQPLLYPYSDGELDLVRHLQVEHHLAECADCAGRDRSLRELREAVAAPSLRYRAPAALREKLRAAPAVPVTPPAPRAAPRRPVPWLAATAAGIAAVAAGVLWSGSVFPAGDRLAGQAVAAHIRSLQVDHLTDVASSDRHTVKPWFRGKLDFSPPVVDLAAQGYALTGGRLDYLTDRPVAALVYHRRLHAINVFVWPAADDSARPVRALSRQGYQVRTWSRSGNEFWVVSDLNAEELDEFVRLIQEATPAAVP